MAGQIAFHYAGDRFAGNVLPDLSAIERILWGAFGQRMYVPIRKRISWLSFSLFACLAALAQPPSEWQDNPFGGRRQGGFGGGRGLPQSSRSDYPMWEVPAEFKHDVFTFVRIEYDSFGRRGSAFGGWRNDYPDCDWNFSFRLQQLTTFRVDPNGRTMRLTDPDLFDYPFIFMTNMGGISLTEEEQAAFRKYLMQGGFMMGDDFWAEAEWNHIKQVMKQVLPDREPRELSYDHELFHLVYDLNTLPQVPSIRAWQMGLAYESWHGPFENNDTMPHFWGYFDDADRLVALFCQNNDIADGWEREGENIEYFERYSQRVSYPLGINIITYAMTH